MAAIANIWWKTLAYILILTISGSQSSTIEGVLHGDVLLPCTVIYKNNFSDEKFVVIWQTLVHPEVLHSFYDRMDHPKHQHDRFKGRTQLFPLEIPKGNLSLLLKNLKTSDAGNYSCHAYLSDDTGGYVIQQVELSIKEPDPSYGPYFYAFFSLPLLLAVVVYIIVRKRNRKEPTPEEVDLLSDTPNCGADSIEGFKRNICQTLKTCCKSGPRGGESDHCLIRTLRIVDMRKLSTDGMSDLQETCVGTVTSRDLFTHKKTYLDSTRMLILGEAGIGKRCFCEELQKGWASGKITLFYKCVIYLTFHDLNAIDKNVSVKQLLESKCAHLALTLTDLLNESGLLLILQGLDEFKHELKDPRESQRMDNITIDTPMDVKTLVSEIMMKNLLPNTDVLVTSGLDYWKKWKGYFTSIFILQEFTDEEIQRYCEEYSKDNWTPTHSYQFIKKYNLSSLVSVPLLNRALCEIAREQTLTCFNNKLDTCSRMLASLLRCSLKNISPEIQVDIQSCCTPAQNAAPNLQEDIKRIFNQLAKLSYENLAYNVHEIKKEDLGDGAELLLKALCQFFLIEKSRGSIFEYRHATIRDIFASLYCVGEIQDENELKECLDAWAFGEISSHPHKKSLLWNVPSNKLERFQNFIRFFLGCLAYRNIDGLLSDPAPLRDDKKPFLCRWFQDWIARDLDRTNLLNIFHCIFELHDTDVTKALSSCFKTVNLCNTQLYSLDLAAMQYSLWKATLEKLDLGQCLFGDGGLTMLTMIKRCKHVWLSSNKLTEVSLENLGKILESKGCIIESLSLAGNMLGASGAERLWTAMEKNTCLRILCLNDNGISGEGAESMVKSLKKNTTLKELLLGRNGLGTVGAKNLWRALKKNRGLKVLCLNDNMISDDGTGGMVESLRKNTSLKELYLCGNTFGEVGLQNIKRLKKERPDLKIIVRIADDEDLLCYMTEKIQHLTHQTDDQERTLYLLQSVLRDLSQGENQGNALVGTLKQKIISARNRILHDKKME